MHTGQGIVVLKRHLQMLSVAYICLYIILTNLVVEANSVDSDQTA